MLRKSSTGEAVAGGTGPWGAVTVETGQSSEGGVMSMSGRDMVAGRGTAVGIIRHASLITALRVVRILPRLMSSPKIQILNATQRVS